MQLSKRTQYGIRAMICLADAYQQGFIQARQLTVREKLPNKFLEAILAALTRGKFLISKIGASGGYRLARPPEEIRIGDIVTRLETGSLSTEPRSSEHAGRPGEVAVRLLHSRISESFSEALNSITLAELAEQVGQTSRGGQMYYI